MFKNTFQSGFLSILYSIGSKPLDIWDKKVRNGHIKRLTDQDIQSSVLEICGTNVSTNYISCPLDPKKTLAIKLPFLVMIIKNLKKYFTFEVEVLDDKNIRRRFRASNYQSQTRVKPFICTMPMRLDEGWNQIQFNLSDFTRRAYGTNYIETLRVQIHANCRIRRIYFSDRLYTEDELPPEFKLFLPLPQVYDCVCAARGHESYRASRCQCSPRTAPSAVDVPAFRPGLEVRVAYQLFISLFLPLPQVPLRLRCRVRCDGGGDQNFGRTKTLGETNSAHSVIFDLQPRNEKGVFAHRSLCSRRTLPSRRPTAAAAATASRSRTRPEDSWRNELGPLCDFRPSTPKRKRCFCSPVSVQPKNTALAASNGGGSGYGQPQQNQARRLLEKRTRPTL
eukprot:TRINITY_DN870_c0_g1_i6.p1 TRINITY_DN870_c0_g1~~TRINITY_DN870_c0_g1_i6.p1  ORF type:complete len:393 (-),score=39.09 TRINITY_DN870_c0_g1_i6:1204-2382(-)